jgi:hypothetical protein
LTPPLQEGGGLCGAECHARVRPAPGLSRYLYLVEARYRPDPPPLSSNCWLHGKNAMRTCCVHLLLYWLYPCAREGLCIANWRDNSCITSRACCVIVYALSTGHRTCAGGWACTTGIACCVMVHAARTSCSTWAGGGVGMHYKLKG